MSIDEQPDPIPNKGPHVIDLAKSLLESRREVGESRYKTPLQIHNGRDFGRDADEEIADFIIYWAGYREEHRQRMELSRSAIKRLSKILDNIHIESVPAGFDFGNSTVAALSMEAIGLIAALRESWSETEASK